MYKYFPDVEAILLAWHQRHVAGHLQQLAELRHQGGDPGQRLEAVLEAYARICYNRGRHGTDELAALPHQHLHALTAASNLPFEAAVRQLLAFALAGLGRAG